MAAAPHLFDDHVVASPELALVDVDLAAQLRDDIRTGEDFRPRQVMRPEFSLLQPVVLAVDSAPESPVVDDVPGDEMIVDADPVVVALDLALDSPVDELSELPGYIVPADEVVERHAPDGAVAEEEASSNGHPVLPDLAVAEVASEPPAVEERVPADEIVIDVDPIVVAVDVPPDSPVDELAELPDDIVVTEGAADDVGTDAFLEVALHPAAVEEPAELPDYIVPTEEVGEDAVLDVEATAAEVPDSNDYPVLPDLGAASEVLEETDAALRKIREQLGSGGEQSTRGRRRLRRGFTIASALGAIGALALVAVDVQQGVASLPGWLGF